MKKRYIALAVAAVAAVLAVAAYYSFLAGFFAGYGPRPLQLSAIP